MSLWVATDHDLLTLYFKLMTFHKLHALRFWELEWHEKKTTEILVGGNFFFFIDAKLLPYILTTVNHRCPSFPEGRGGGPYTGYMDAKVFDVILFFNTAYNKLLLHKHQWNTRWAFAQKLDIFTCENNMLSSHVKISPLLWLHNKSRLSHQKTIKVKWFGSSLVFI